MAGGIFSLAKLFGITLRESANDGSDFTNPDADYRRLFLGEDGTLHLKDSAGTVTDVGGGDVSAHLADTTDAHDASAISILDVANDFTATDVEGALAELQADAEAHLADASGAHAASAISFSPAGTIAATDVQAAIEEVASEAGGGVTGSEAALGGDVGMGVANQFYDGPSLSLNGTYLVIAQVTVRTTATVAATAKLWNGTTVSASGEHVIHGNTYVDTITLVGIVTTSGAETWKVSVAANGTTATLKAAAPENGAGNNATKIVALKIA
jgi:hypothetical protein